MRDIITNSGNIFPDCGNGVIVFNDHDGAGVCDFYVRDSGVFDDGEREGMEWMICECHETGEIVRVVFEW